MAHELRKLGWDAFALTGGFTEWQQEYGADSLEVDTETSVTPVYDRL